MMMMMMMMMMIIIIIIIATYETILCTGYIGSYTKGKFTYAEYIVYDTGRFEFCKCDFFNPF